MNSVDLDQQQLLIERGERLRVLRKTLRMTIVEFANLCECGESTIRQWEQGRASGLTEKGAMRIYRSLESTDISCDVEWLLEGIHQPPHAKHVAPPSSTTTYYSAPSLMAEKSANEAQNIKQEIDYFNQLAIEPLIMRVQDDAMEPYFFKGDYVAGKCLYGEEIEKLVGQVCVAQTTDGLLLLRLLHSTSTNKYRLTALNLNTIADFLVLETELIGAALVTRLWRNPDDTIK